MLKISLRAAALALPLACVASASGLAQDAKPGAAPEDPVVAQVGEFNQELEKAGAWVFAGGLHPASSATTLRPDGGEVSMVDGPYAESKEQMGGFWVVEAADLDAALAWGRRAAAACEGPVEVRPFQGE